MLKTFDITLDLQKPTKFSAFTVSQGDLNSVVLNITLMKGNQPINLQDSTVRIAIEKPSKNTIFKDCEIINAEEGICSVKLDTQATIEAGTYASEIYIYDGDIVSVTGSFTYFSKKTVMNDNAVVSTNDWQAINQAINNAQTILDQAMNYIPLTEVNHEILWKVQTAGKEAVYSTPIVTTLSTGVKVVVYTSWDWFVYCRNAETGELLWRYATAAPCYGRCQAEDVDGDGKVEIIAASHDGYVYCFDEQGNRKWTFANAYIRDGIGTVTSSTVTSITDTTKQWVTNEFIRGAQGINASVEITSGTMQGQKFEIKEAVGNTITFFASTGTTIPVGSTYKVNNRYESDPYYQHAGTLNKENNKWFLYVTGFDGQIAKLDASNGSLIWKYSTLESIEPFPYIIDINNDGVEEVLVNALDKHTYCLNSQTGEVIWKTQFEDSNDSFIEVHDIDGDGILEVLISSRDNRVHVLNGLDGTIKASTRDTGGDIDCRPLALGNTFYCGSDSANIFAYDTEGEVVWGYKTTDSTNTSMVLGILNGSNLLIQGDQSGALHILTPEGKVVKVLYLRGGIEGTPFIENNNDHILLYVPTIEGWFYKIKLQ
ncbi:BppU family phage baseplate upper protein [Priestia megaterium]|uniref:BppU family phage baseplate upper protein n=1 Tax=Priestia megaterium TaxID=1404 RepID=UPI003D2A47BD